MSSICGNACQSGCSRRVCKSRSPKTVTQIGFATPWILISVDPLMPKMRRRRLATLGRQPGAGGDEHDPPVCEICLVVGAYRRLPCPPMDRPPTCKSTTGRPDTAPTTSVHFPHGFGSTLGACGPRGRTRSNEVFRRGSNQPRALAQYAGVVLVLSPGMLAESQERQRSAVALPGPPTLPPLSGAAPGSARVSSVGWQ